MHICLLRLRCWLYFFQTRSVCWRTVKSAKLSSSDTTSYLFRHAFGVIRLVSCIYLFRCMYFSFQKQSCFLTKRFLFSFTIPSVRCCSLSALHCCEILARQTKLCRTSKPHNDCCKMPHKVINIANYVQGHRYTQADMVFVIWASYCNPLLDRTRSRGRCWAAIQLSHRPEPCSPWGRWIGHWMTTWSTVCSSAPHSQAAEDILHLYKQERKRPTPVRRRLSRTHTFLGRAIPGGWVPVSGMKVPSLRSVLQPFCIPLVIRPVHCTYFVVRWTDELLCGGYKLVSQFDVPCICTRWTGERWVE